MALYELYLINRENRKKFKAENKATLDSPRQSTTRKTAGDVTPEVDG